MSEFPWCLCYLTTILTSWLALTPQVYKLSPVLSSDKKKTEALPLLWFLLEQPSYLSPSQYDHPLILLHICLTSVLPLEKVRDFQTTKPNWSDLSGFLTSSPVNLALSLDFLTTCIFLGKLPHFLSLTYWRRCARFTTLVTFPAALRLCSSCTSYSP